MAKKKHSSAPGQALPAVAPPPQPTIHEATLAAAGGVQRGRAITQVQAEARRRNGDDVVVCGPDLVANRALAKLIEQNGNGKWKLCPPHVGPLALPHCQPNPRPPAGHTFYETQNRKAI
jgi:hypothetical protein